MKRKAKKKMVLKTMLAGALSLMMALGLIPGTGLVITAHASGTADIQLVTDGVAAGIADGHHVYFGTFPETGYVHTNARPGNTEDTSTEPYWRVLDADHENVSSTAEESAGAMFVLSETLWGTGGTYGDVYFNNVPPYSNIWAGSTAQGWCATFLGGAFRARHSILY